MNGNIVVVVTWDQPRFHGTNRLPITSLFFFWYDFDIIRLSPWEILSAEYSCRHRSQHSMLQSVLEQMKWLTWKMYRHTQTHAHGNLFVIFLIKKRPSQLRANRAGDWKTSDDEVGSTERKTANKWGLYLNVADLNLCCAGQQPMICRGPMQ